MLLTERFQTEEAQLKFARVFIKDLFRPHGCNWSNPQYQPIYWPLFRPIAKRFQLVTRFREKSHIFVYWLRRKIPRLWP